jgi:hypothetical protein
MSWIGIQPFTFKTQLNSCYLLFFTLFIKRCETKLLEIYLFIGSCIYCLLNINSHHIYRLFLSLYCFNKLSKSRIRCRWLGSRLQKVTCNFS